MAELVRVRIGNVEKNVSAGFAQKHDLQVLDEPVLDHGGRPRPTTRVGGRPLKPRTTVDQAAAAKQDNQTENHSDDRPDADVDQQGSATDPSTPEEAQQ